ncbi:MAG: ion transporter, partial [Pseudomonadota bacterium]
RLSQHLDSPRIQSFIIAVIIVNAITLGMETSKTLMNAIGGLILTIDRICLAIFTVEIAVKLFARGPAFFRSGWNIFDFIVVAISYVPDAGALSVLRALRILRVLRLVSTMPRLRRVIEGFLSAVPGMASVFGLMALIFYISSVISTKLFAASFPEWFGTLGRSAYSLFQIMTLESWSMGIVRPVMEVYPFAWVFFVPFILVTTFAVVNLVVGLIVNSMQDAHAQEEVAATTAYREEIVQRLEAIEQKLSEKR